MSYISLLRSLQLVFRHFCDQREPVYLIAKTGNTHIIVVLSATRISEWRQQQLNRAEVKQ